MAKKRARHVVRLLIFLGIILMVIGCAHKGAVKQAELDTPEHHYTAGNILLEKGELDGALAEFERAKAIDPEYAPAYVGIGLVLGEQGEFEKAFAAMESAKDYAESDAEEVFYNTGMIRLYTASLGDKWLKRAEDHFSSAIDIDEIDPAPYYFMGLAYKKAENYEKSSGLFRKVIDLKKGYTEQANAEWEKVQNIVRAMPGSKVGRQIAKLDKITRADVAALFVEEMNLDKIFMRHKVAFKEKGVAEESAPNDYQNHILKSDIDIVNTLGIKGLEVIGNRFDPDGVIRRADFAIMVEDILVKVTGENTLPTSYIDSPSPFKDVDESYYAKNAIMTCTTRGFMKADLNGYFKGGDPVSGADALLTIRRLNDALKF